MLREFICWFVTGHQWDWTECSIPAVGVKNTCIYCGKEVEG